MLHLEFEHLPGFAPTIHHSAAFPEAMEVLILFRTGSTVSPSCFGVFPTQVMHTCAQRNPEPPTSVFLHGPFLNGYVLPTLLTPEPTSAVAFISSDNVGYCSFCFVKCERYLHGKKQQTFDVLSKAKL